MKKIMIAFLAGLVLLTFTSCLRDKNGQEPVSNDTQAGAAVQQNEKDPKAEVMSDPEESEIVAETNLNAGPVPADDKQDVPQVSTESETDPAIQPDVSTDSVPSADPNTSSFPETVIAETPSASNEESPAADSAHTESEFDETDSVPENEFQVEIEVSDTDDPDEWIVISEPSEPAGTLIDPSDAVNSEPDPVIESSGYIPAESDNTDNEPENPSASRNDPENVQLLKWEEFYALSGTEKDNYLNSFPDYDSFLNWMMEAQETFRQEHPDIEIGNGGQIDLSKLQ